MTDTVLWRVPSHELSKVDFSEAAAADREDRDGRTHWRNEESLDARWHNAVTPEIFGNKTMSDGIVVDLNGHVVITEMEYVFNTCGFLIIPFKYPVVITEMDTTVLRVALLLHLQSNISLC